MEDIRYQYQPWYVKLWRMRHLVPVPFYAVSTWLRSGETLGVCWSIHMGMAHFRMEYYYTSDEVRQRCEERRLKS